MPNPHARDLPAKPRLEQQRRRAKDLLKALHTADPVALERLRYSHPRLTHATFGDAAAAKLADAQWVIAREYGFSSWPALKAHIDGLNGRAPPQHAFETDPQYYRDRAFGLLSVRETRERGALRIIQRNHPAFAGKSEAEIAAAPFTQADAELVVAREHGFENFAELEAHVAALAAGMAADPFKDAFEAIKADDLAALERLLTAHPDLVKAAGTNANTLLSLATGFGRDAMAQMLLQRGSSPDQANNKGSTALHQAAYSGSTDDGNEAIARIERLLAAGASVEAEAYGEGGTPLAFALFWGHVRLSERLAAEAVVPLNLRTAAGLGRVDLMQSLAEPDGRLRPEAGWRREFHRPHSGFPPWRPVDEPQQILDEALTYAARNGRIEAMAWLVDHGADVNAEPCRGTSLAWAARRGQADFITWLLDHGAEIDRPSGFGGVDWLTPLQCAAAWNGQLEAAKVLVARGANLQLEDPAFHSKPAGWARYFGNPAIAELIEAQA